MPPTGTPKNGSDPFKGKKKLFGLQGSWYSNPPARTHNFNTETGFKKFADAARPKLLPKLCRESVFQTKPAKFDTFWPVSGAYI